MEINTKVNNIKMAKGMVKVLFTLPMEIDTKGNLKMINIMAKVLSTLLMASNKRDYIRTGS